MLQEQAMTDALRSLAAELDELGREDEPRLPEIPGFEPVDILDRGGMGTVYLAQQPSLGREVALKVVHASGAGNVDEAKTIAQLHHPNIVQVYAAGESGGRAWFAMELMRGKTASCAVFASAGEVARLGIQIADALSYAHRCGVIHRDVKSANIFIGENGIAKLGDFGLANTSGESGTRGYMAPELLEGGAASEASDQYALGATLAALAPAGDGDFAAICAKAMSPAPEERYQSIDAMLDDLRSFIAGRPVAANPPSPLRRFRLFAHRNPAAAAGLAAAALLLAAFMAALAIGCIRTSQALAATEREAASAAQSLASVVAEIDRGDSNKRDAELERALTAAEHLAARFPGNEEIAAAVAKLKAARQARERFLERRGGAATHGRATRRPGRQNRE